MMFVSMLMMLRRILTYVTVVMCLFVAIISVRVLNSSEKKLTLNLSSFNTLSTPQIAQTEIEPVAVEEIQFAEMVFPVEQPKAVIAAKKVDTRSYEYQIKQAELARFELPFGEMIELRPIKFDAVFLENLVSLYNDLPSEEKLIAKYSTVKDEVKTAQASSEEPVFLDYGSDEESKTSDTEQVSHQAEPSEVASADMVPTEEMKAEKPIAVTEEQNIDDLVAFDYSKAEQDVTTQKMPTVSHTTLMSAPVTVAMTQAQPAHPVAETRKQTASGATSSPVTTQPPVPTPGPENQTDEESIVPNKSLTQTTVEVIGTDLKGNQKLTGFEMSFHDDYSQRLDDANSGEIAIDTNPAQPKMTRAIRLIKRGFASTNADIILEQEGGSMTIPLIEEETFNELMAPYENNGPTGAVLVELDDDTEYAQLDVPFAKVILLDGDLRETTSNDNRYQLFLGVRAGNAMVTYRRYDRQAATKIIHVHFREVTFDNKFFDESEVKALKLFEEDLLSKEKLPLVIASEQVKVFATDRVASKLNDHTYKLELERRALGGRRYLELLHQNEPVFVGFNSQTKVNVPSENYMRHILSSFENNKLGNRCLIQLNLSKKVADVIVGSESVEDTLHTTVQMLDRDGRFYDSISDKTRKVVIMGESQAAADVSHEGRINIKLEYVDGSTEFLNSYCSPNSYMVEQL